MSVINILKKLISNKNKIKRTCCMLKISVSQITNGQCCVYLSSRFVAEKIKRNEKSMIKTYFSKKFEICKQNTPTKK